MKSIFVAVALVVGLTSVGFARELKVPEKNPTMSITFPDSWGVDEITYGYNATSEDDTIFFSVEFASGARVDKMLANNADWMKDNQIVAKGKPVEADVILAGQPSHVLHYDATDIDGDTTVDFVFIPAGEKRIVMLTLWGTEEDLEENDEDIEAIKKSIKALN